MPGWLVSITFSEHRRTSFGERALLEADLTRAGYFEAAALRREGNDGIENIDVVYHLSVFVQIWTTYP